MEVVCLSLFQFLLCNFIILNCVLILLCCVVNVEYNLILSVNFAVTRQGGRILLWECTMLLASLVPGFASFHYTVSCMVWLSFFLLASFFCLLLLKSFWGCKTWNWTLSWLVLDRSPNKADYLGVEGKIFMMKTIIYSNDNLL